MANVQTKPNSDVLHHYQQSYQGMPGTTFGRDPKTIAQNVRRILGDQIDLGRTMNMGEMNLHEGVGQSTWGIPFQIDGTATVVEDTVAIWIAGFRDPIKTIFDTSVHRSQKVIFKRKWVKGSQALVVPERAPARTISIAFDQREERLTRHAIALEQSIYLYLREADAREDLNMKLEGIRLQLEQALVSIGYDKAFSQGTNIVSALERGSTLTAMRDATQRAIEADRMYVNMFCGVISKSQFPFKNLAASIGRAAIYTPTGKSRQTPAVMLVPPGMIDLPKYTKPSEMNFNVTGLKTTDGRNKVSLPLPHAFQYPDANIMVYVHVPPAGCRKDGAAYPQVEHNEMENVVVQAFYYVESQPMPTADVDQGYDGDMPFAVNASQCIVTDFKQKEWAVLDKIRPDNGAFAPGSVAARLQPVGGWTTKDGTVLGDNAGLDEHFFRWYLRPQFATVNDSALLCSRPGKETGELLYAYPAAHVSTSQHTGSLLLTLTTYYGCAIRHSENLFVLNGIKYSGLVGGEGTSINAAEGDYDEDKDDLLPFITRTAPWNTVELWKDTDFIHQARDIYKLYPANYFKGANQSLDSKIKRTSDVPVIYYRGTTRLNGGLKPRKANNGGPGVLDHPANIGVLQGYQVYTEIVPTGET